MTPDYVVVWNGVNDGQDSDLLSDGVRQGKRHVDARVKPQAPEKVYAALAPDRTGARSLRELVARTGLTPDNVGNALYLLRQRGVLGSVRLDGQDASARGYRCVYWRCG
jgi:hypothetical protein